MISDIKKIQCKLQFHHTDCVEVVGKAGGLAIFWNDDISLEVCFKNPHVIDSIIKDNNGLDWCL